MTGFIYNYRNDHKIVLPGNGRGVSVMCGTVSFEVGLVNHGAAERALVAHFAECDNR